MSAAVANGSGPSLPHRTNHELKIEYWSSLLPHIAQAIVAHQNAQKNKQLADVWSSRRHQSVAITNEAAKATAQVAVHKGEFEASVRALAELTPDSLVFGMLPPPPSVPSVHDKVAVLEAKVTQMGERQQSHHRWIDTFDDSVKAAENANKTLEEEHTKTTAQLTKAHKQLEGKVTQLENVSRLPSKPSHDARIHPGTEKRLESVEATLKDALAKSNNLDQRLKAVSDAQRKAQEQYAHFTTTVNEFKVTQRETKEVREKIDPLLPLAPKAQLILSNLASTDRFRDEVKSRNEAVKVRLDLVGDMCKAATKSVEDLRKNEVTPLVALKTEIAGLLSLKDHVSELAKLPETIQLIHTTVTEFVPIKEHVKELMPLVAQAAPILALVSQQDQTTRTVQQLESDVTSCMNALFQNQSSPEDLDNRLKAVEAWRPTVEQQKDVASEQARLKGTLDRHEQSMRSYAESHNRSARDMETLKAGIRKVQETQQSSEVHVLESVASIGSLCTQVGQAHASLRTIRSELTETNAKVTVLKDIEINAKSSQAAAEQAQRDVKSLQDKVAAIAPLNNRVQALVALADRRDVLASLPEQLVKVQETVADVKAENEQRMGQLEVLVGHAQKEAKASVESVDRSHGAFKKTLEGLTSRIASERQRAQELEGRVSELQKDSGAALEARTKLQASVKAARNYLDVAQTRLDALEPLKDHVNALAAVADKQVQLVSLAQSFKQAQAVSGHVENVFVACQGVQAKVVALQTSVERLDKRKDQTADVQALTSEVDKLRPLVDRVAKVEELAEGFPKQYAPLESVDRVQDKISKCESECKVLQGKMVGSSKGLKTEMFELKTKAEDALRVSNETAQSVDQLTPLKSHVPVLMDLSGQSEHLLGLGKQAEATESGIAKLFVSQEKSTRRYNEMVDSVDLMRKSVEGVERKANEVEVNLGTLGQEVRSEKDTWALKMRAMEADISRLTPEQHNNNAMIGLVTPSGSPMSPTHRTMSAPDSRIAVFERFADSAKRELKNIAQNLTRIDGERNLFKKQLAEMSARLPEVQTQTDGGALSPLAEHVSALVSLAAQEGALSRTSEHAKTLAGVVRRVNTFDSSLKDLDSRVPTAQQVKLLDGIPKLKELSVEIPSLKKLMPLAGHVDALVSLAGQAKAIVPLVDQVGALTPLVGKVDALSPLVAKVEALSPLAAKVEALSPLVAKVEALSPLAAKVEALSPLVGQVKSLLPLVQRVERVEPLLYQFEKLSPLPARVTELQGSIADLQKAAAESSVRAQPVVPVQTLSPTSTQRRPVPLPVSPSRVNGPTALLPSPNIGSSSPRTSKKRKLEEALESLEDRYESMRQEVDDVLWNMSELEKNMTSPKRSRTSEVPAPSPEPEAVAESDELQLDRSDDSELGIWRKKLGDDVDRLQRAVMSLWEGENGWSERFEAALESAWAKSLNLREAGDESTGLAIARLLNVMRLDIDALALAVQSRGPTTMVLGASVIESATEKIAERILAQMAEQHTEFKTDLGEWLNKVLKPVKKMCRAMSNMDDQFD